MKQRLTHLRLAGAILGLGVIAATDATAQGFFDFNCYNYSKSQECAAWMTASRFMTMIGATALGFAIGWLFLPAGQELRRVMLLVVAGIALTIALANQDALGWGLTRIIAYWVFAGGSAIGWVPSCASLAVSNDL